MFLNVQIKFKKKTTPNLSFGIVYGKKKNHVEEKRKARNLNHVRACCAAKLNLLCRQNQVNINTKTLKITYTADRSMMHLKRK